MSTKDVPGHDPKNRDVLAMGCWGEAADGSLILVEGNENGRTIYSMFDAAKDPVMEYRDAMPEVEFKAAFSFGADKSPLKGKPTDKVPDLKWTWHDKTPFPWSRVIKQGAKDGLRFASAADQLAHADALAASLKDAPSAPVQPKTNAEKVADSLGLKADKLRETGHLGERTMHAVGGMMRRIGEKLENIGK